MLAPVVAFRPARERKRALNFLDEIIGARGARLDISRSEAVENFVARLRRR